MNKNSLSNASNKRRSNHNPTQSSSTSLSKAPVLGRNDSSIMSNNHHEDPTNIETTTNASIATIDNSTIDTNNYSVSCICGKPLIRVTLSESYSDEPSVCCNMCFMIYRNPKDVIYICELRKTTQFHNNGYGFCQSCASKLSQEESANALNPIARNEHHISGAELIKNRLNGTIAMLECDGNKHEFLPFMDRMSWFERVGLEYLAKQHMTDDEMKEMKDKLQGIKDKVIEKAFDLLKSKIVEIDTMVTRLQEIQIRGNTKLLKEYNIKIRIHRRQLLRIQNESSGKYRNQHSLLHKLNRMRHCINEKTLEQIASCVCGEELFAMSVQECNYSDSWWCSHCCETYYKHDLLYHCENGKKCIYNELMQYIYDLCQNCWSRLKINHATEAKEEETTQDGGTDPSHLMIRKRLWESLQILENCITSAHTKDANEDSLEVMDKLAKRICNFETQFVKLKTCLEDEEREKCSFKMQELVNILKQHLSLCLCGDIMIKLKATNYYCAHCFQTFKGKERVITFCRRRDKCKFYQNGYRLCEHCSNDLMKEKILNHNGTNPEESVTEEYIIGQYANHTTKSSNANVDDQKQENHDDMVSNTNNNTNTSHNVHSNGPNVNNSEAKEPPKEEKKNINWTVCCRIEQRLQQSICILEQSATEDMTKCNHTLTEEKKEKQTQTEECKDDKTQWNEHWNDWISRCNQFSSCLNKTKEHLHSAQFTQITDNFEIVKRRAVQRTLKQTNESITEISNALNSVQTIESYRRLNNNVTEFRRQLLKMKRHGQDVDIDNQLERLGSIRDGIHEETGDRMTTCICGEQLFRRKASECYGNNYWCNRCFKTYSKDTYLFHCEVHKECEYHQFGYDLCEECAMVLRNDENDSQIVCESDPDHICRIVHRLRASLGILENDVVENSDSEHKDDMAKRVDNFEMQYDPLMKWLSPHSNSEIGCKLRSICDLIKPFLPLCLCGSWFKHGSCDNAFICRCCSASYEKGVETYYCKNTENCLYWKHGYNLCETCALTYKSEKHKMRRLTDRIVHRLWNSIHHIESGYRDALCAALKGEHVTWDSLVLRYDNCEQYIQKCTYTHWLYNILSTGACLDNTQSYLMAQRLNALGVQFKSYVPVCLCGDVFIYVQSPYELDCKHCFKELKENDKTYFCKSRDDCQHWNNSYYLCEDCVRELRRRRHPIASRDERIKWRLRRSVQILAEYVRELKEKDDDDDDDGGGRWLKMAYKVDQCKQHSDKLAVELDAEWCDEFEGEFGRLIDEVKIRVPLCLCGAFFVHETSPIDFRCRHCFKLYDTDGVVIHYCQQQRDCAHFNSDYYLCNDCAMSLRKSHWAEGIGDRASSRLMNSIGIIGAAVESATVAAVDEWKDVSVRVYFYEQQLERLRTHLCSEEGTQLASKLEETLHQMKQHLATCLCGNLFVSGPSPIDYECRSCFDECRVEENIYVCKSKQKCQHWRNHYYICDDCSILLRKSSKFDSESLRIVDRLDGAISFIRDEFTGAIQSQLLLQPQNKDLSIFNKYLHKASSFYSNFLSQIASHITAIQLEETLLCYRALKSYILKTSNKFVDEKYRNKLKSEMIMFGFIRELYLSLDIDCVIHSAVPEYVFHVCLDYYFQIHPQMIVIAASNAIQCADFNDGSSSNLSFYDIKSFNKSIFKKKRSCCTIRCATPSISIKKDSPFTMAINISIPSFIRSIKPSLFDENHHYDVVFNPHQALIIDSCNFNHHYSDHYAFKSRSILSTKRHQTHRRQQNGYSLSLPAALRNTSSVLFDYGRAQLLAYSNHSLYWLPFNEAIHSENEWKWTRLSQQQMKWSRHAPSLAMCGDEDNQLFIVGDVQMNHAKYTEMYCFARQEWMQCAHCPYAAECLYNDDVDDRMFYLGGNQRNAGYYDAHKDEWCKIPSTTYVYKKHNSVIWNELRHASQQVLWAANTNQCEFLDLRQDERQWQTFPNLDNNNTHHKLHNLINKRFDPAATNDNSAASDYTLLCRI